MLLHHKCVINKMDTIVSVPVWDNIRIHCLSFIFGVWVVFKRFAKWIWDPNGFFSLQLRDNPPSCLVDSSLGQHKYVKLKGVKLHYVEAGSRDKPLVLLLHGFPDCWLSWRNQIPVLANHFRVVALDLKGFGDSDKPAWRSSYRIDTILEELIQLIQSLGVSSCTLIGHDLGALLGWYLVYRNPKLIDKFVAVSCPHPNIFFKTMRSSNNYQWVNFVQLPYLPEIDALKQDVKIIDEYYKHLPKKDTYLEAYKYTFSRKEDWTGPINYYRNLPFTKIYEESDQIGVTTVLITGSKDPSVKLESVVMSTDYCDKFYVKIVENCGHFPHQENPEVCNNLLLKYLVHKSSNSEKGLQRSPSKGLMDRMFGAVSSTVKYGNTVLDSVQKKTNGVVNSIPSINISFSNNELPKTD